MTLSEIYDLAKHTPDYPEFEQLVKSELTGLPYTQVIDCEVEIRVKALLAQLIYTIEEHLPPEHLIRHSNSFLTLKKQTRRTTKTKWDKKNFY
jgi:DNA-binding LytR/AlgR family response regulator